MNEIDLQTARTITTVSLSDSARDRVQRSRRDSTRLAYRGDLRRFLDWCARLTITTPLPESPSDDHLMEAFAIVLERTPTTIAAFATEYVNHLADEGKAPSTVERALSAIAVAYRAATGERLNTDQARAVITTHRRDRAEAGFRPRKTKAATVAKLRQMVAALDTTQPIGVRDRAIIVDGFALGGRRSEIAALDIDDLTEADEGFEVVIRTSKTDKESVGRVAALLYGSDPNTCPVRTLKAWLAVLADHDRTTGPLFVRIDSHGNLGRVPTGRGSADGRMTGQAVAIVVQRAAKAAGISADGVWAGHSLRRGFATEARRAGHDATTISRGGGWVEGSRALAGYFEEADRWTDNALKGIGL